MSKGKNAAVLRIGAGVLALLAGSALGADFIHQATIDLSDVFNSTSGYGDNPLSVAFDGTNAYVGGFKNTAESPATVGVVKIENVTGDSPVKTPLLATQFTSPTSRGIDAVAYEPTTTALIISHDAGGTAGFITRRQASDGALGGAGWTVTNPQGARPFAMAIDPKGNAGAPGVAFLAQGSGRRRLLSLVDGSTIFDGSAPPTGGGIINGSPTFFGTAWRAMAFDPDGNIAVTEDSGFQYGVRDNENRWSALDATPNVTSSSVAKTCTATCVNNVGQGIVIAGNLAPEPNLLVFAGRSYTSTTDLLGATTNVTSSQVQIRNLNGSTTDVAVTALTGSENGIGTAWTAELKNFAYGTDAGSKNFLLVVDFISRRLDVYEVKPTPAGPSCREPFADFDGDHDVDMDDFGAFQACYTGSTDSITEGCACFDRTGDDRIDLADFGVPSSPQPNTFIGCVSGPNIPADTSCDGAP